MLKKTFFKNILNLAAILILPAFFLLFQNAFAQTADLSNVRLSVAPASSSGIVANDQTAGAIFTVTGAPSGAQICLVLQGNKDCPQGAVTDSSGQVQIPEVMPQSGTFFVNVLVNDQSAPNASASVTVTSRTQVSGVDCTQNSQCAAGEYCNTSVQKCQSIAGSQTTNPGGVPATTNSPEPAVSPTPYTGLTPPAGVGNVGSLAPSSNLCGGDPNLVYDTNAKICLPKGEQCSSGSIACVPSLSALLIKIIDYLLFFAGAIAVVFIIIGGFWYITAAGNEEQAEKGKKALINAIIGIVLISLAFLIIKIIANTLNSNSVIGK